MFARKRKKINWKKNGKKIGISKFCFSIFFELNFVEEIKMNFFEAFLFCGGGVCV